MGVLGILIPLALLIYLAFRGVTLIFLAPVMAVLAAALSGGLPVLASYTQIFMEGLGGFVVAFFPLFLLGAIFGRLMDDSGAAAAISNAITERLGRDRAVLSVVLCCAVLTYGGVSLFVVAFAVFPVAAALFRDAAIPKRIIPAALALGAFTFTMSALPGTPAIQNAIPMPFFGTTAFAAPGLGIIAGTIMLVLGVAWLERRAAAARSAGEGYGAHEDSVPPPGVRTLEGARRDGLDLRDIKQERRHDRDLPPLSLAALPVVVVVAVNLAFLQLVAPRLETGYLATPLFGATTIEAVRGLWSIILALCTAILVLIATNLPRLESLGDSLNAGANAAVIPIANTASLVGFGAVIAATPAFATLGEWVLGLGQSNPLLSLAVAVNLLSAVTGSASGGMTIALDTLGPTYVELARQQGISFEAMHRVSSISSGALDALPHNGAVITVLGICKLGHREAYGDIFVVAVVIPMLALSTILLLATVFGAF
ncbi:GntP family permease [Paralimibaculum aggregatum]|uniref:GntP family permease n=1 Tax=Paralimibaculum aggregatum TaxID=3036245 RepID=A0ABQ6LMS7_9RHOB|nr:GntP family permease [Limibaculum sp. NKW23]GMG84483.1 GntP family permease [Limibaculum sp. NKW23]